MISSEYLLNVRNLTIHHRDGDHSKEILNGFSFDIKPSKIVALVGGSGSGKTTLGLAILRLLAPGFSVYSGEINFLGSNLLTIPTSQLQQIRGNQISMVFQEPLSAFNPLLTIGHQIEEVLIYHLRMKKQKRKGRVLELLDMTGIPDPKRVVRSYPHQLSGGLRQRAMLSLAIATNPKLLIADEPTSNLDVTLQARIVELLKKLRQELKLTILLITHDLGLVTHLADEVAILYNGKVVEKGVAQEVFVQPEHPFTEQLVKAVSV